MSPPSDRFRSAFHIIRLRSLKSRSTRRFALALLLISVFAVCYRGPWVVTRLTDVVIAENTLERPPSQHIQTFQHLPENRNAQTYTDNSPSMSQTQPQEEKKQDQLTNAPGDDLPARESSQADINLSSMSDVARREENTMHEDRIAEDDNNRTNENAEDGVSISSIAEAHRQQNSSYLDQTMTDGDEKLGEDPCAGRPQPAPIPRNVTKAPSLYFLHIPKTAGTLMHLLVIRYANKTGGLPCQYVYDGNRFAPHDYATSVKPPPTFPSGSIEQQTIDAISSKNSTRKLELLNRGACRTMRGHVTYRQRDSMSQPVISLTVVRHPLERFVSMYEFAMMMVRTRPGSSGWDNLITGNLQADFTNSSSLVNKGFYDKNGWIARDNIGFSFHFYGVLHQLSGMNPVFEDVGIPEQFRVSNADQLAEKAKDNICSTHILGSQSDMNATLDLFFETLAPYSNWTDVEIKGARARPVNKNVLKKNATWEAWPDTMRLAMERRFQHELEVYNFALAVIDYRKQAVQDH